MKKNLRILFIIFIFNSFVFAENSAVVDLYEINGYNMALRSFFYPGLGQIYMEKKEKGYLFLTASTFSILASVYYKNYSDKLYEDYVSSGGYDTDLYDDYKHNYNACFVCIGITFCFYLYSIYDAYITGEDIYYKKRSVIPISMSIIDDAVIFSISKKF